MPKMNDPVPTSDLEALLEAASEGPWEATEGWIDDAHNADLLSSEGAFYSFADASLTALAPALAREVLDRREVGEALAEMAGYIVAPVRSQHMRDTTDDCDDARCIACDELADWDKALDRWAKLREAEGDIYDDQ